MGSGLKPLRLPYKSRNVDLALKIIRQAITSLPSGDMVLVASDTRSVTEKCIVCRASEISVSVVYENVFDELSGLRHRVPVVVIRIGSCVVRSRWAGSRVVLSARDFLECNQCVFERCNAV